MTSKQEKIVAQENAKRKELSRVRIFWLLIGIDVALIIYVVIQILLLVQGKK